MSHKKSDNIPLFGNSLPGYTWQCALNYTDIKLETRQHKVMILLLEINIRRSVGSVRGDRQIKLGDNKQIMNVSVKKMYGWAMSQSLPYDEIKFGTCVSLEEILST